MSPLKKAFRKPSRGNETVLSVIRKYTKGFQGSFENFGFEGGHSTVQRVKTLQPREPSSATAPRVVPTAAPGQDRLRVLSTGVK
jgi:hypothetical protein